MKILVLIMLAFGAISGFGPAIAEAQPLVRGDQGPQVPTAQQPAGVAGLRASVVKKYPHGDRVEGKGRGMALLFWAFAAATIGGALFVITRRNLIAAVMGMVGCFMGISAVYMMLYANFLTVIQMLVYAGAIMVLFVFVVMILNRPEDEPIAPSGRIGQVVGGAAILYLIYRLVMILIHVKVPNEATAMAAPQAVMLPPLKPGVPGESVDWGSTKAVGADLFGPGLFPFEAISILLLIAVVGAIAIARPVRDGAHAGEAADAGGKP